MTDMLHKPNGWDSPLNQMTEEEWKEYFRLREDLDKEYSEEELEKALLKINVLLEDKCDKEAEELMLAIPLEPFYAYQLKLGLGIKRVMFYNLSLAKKEFPDEF